MSIKKTSLTVALVSLGLTFSGKIALADQIQIPASAIICLIEFGQCGGDHEPVYYLSTSVEDLIRIIPVGPKTTNACKTTVDPNLAKAALANLNALADDLQAHGVCGAIVDNVSNTER